MTNISYHCDTPGPKTFHLAITLEHYSGASGSWITQEQTRKTVNTPPMARAIDMEFPGRASDAMSGLSRIYSFNDNPATTREDCLLVCATAHQILQQERNQR